MKILIFIQVFNFGVQMLCIGSHIERGNYDGWFVFSLTMAIFSLICSQVMLDD